MSGGIKDTSMYFEDNLSFSMYLNVVDSHSCMEQTSLEHFWPNKLIIPIVFVENIIFLFTNKKIHSGIEHFLNFVLNASLNAILSSRFVMETICMKWIF